ncbi:MAG: hypothetical protein WKF36_02535 [Candidatus Nitrosocosmicus sp.]
MDLDVPYGTFDYISKLFSSIIELHEIDDSVMQILSYFILKKHLSAYQIFKKEKSLNNKLDYSITNKKVKRLLDLDLIEKIKDYTQLSEVELKRNAIYYKLTEQGLFALYLKHKTYPPRPTVVNLKGKERLIPITLSKNSLLRYREYDFYKFCLYPWMSYNTIASCSQQFAKKIHDSLSDISLYIEKYLISSYYEDLISLQSKKYDDYQRVIDAGGIGDMESLFKKIGYSKDKEDNSTISLKKDNGKTIPLPYLNFKEKKIFEQMMYDSYKRIVSVNFKSMYYRAIFSLVSENIKDDDKKILRQDLKFKKMLTQLNNHFRSNYDLLCET